jgi:ribosomal protein S6
MKSEKDLYHIIFAFGSSITEDKRTDYIKKSKDVFTSFGMSVFDEKKTGVTKFAYSIKKHIDGFYYVISVKFKNPQISIKNVVLTNVKKEIQKVCGDDLIRYQCLNDLTLQKLFG